MILTVGKPVVFVGSQPMVMAAFPFRVVLAGATGLLLVGGVAAAFTVDDSTEVDTVADARSGTPDEASSTTLQGGSVDGAAAPVPAAPDAVTTPSTGPTEPTTTASGQGTTTTTGRSGASGALGALMVPKVGLYSYDSTSSSSGRAASTSKATVIVEAAGTEGATTLQDITLPSEQLGPIRNRVAWGASGAIVRRSQASGVDCAWKPEWPQYVGALKVGKAWNYDTRCPVTTPIQGTVERRGSRRVTGTQTVTAAGRQLATWTIAVDETTVITTALGANTIRSVGTEQLAPSIGLPVVKTESVSGTSVPPGSTSTQKLTALP